MNELNAKFIHERAGYEARIRELETKISLVAVELEREHAAADMRLREIESWRERYSRLESTKIEEIRTLISQQISLSRKVNYLFYLLLIGLYRFPYLMTKLKEFSDYSRN